MFLLKLDRYLAQRNTNIFNFYIRKLLAMFFPILKLLYLINNNQSKLLLAYLNNKFYKNGQIYL